MVYRDRFRIYIVALGSIVDGGKVGELAAFAPIMTRRQFMSAT
jgi:hypothetical protein